MFVKFKQNHNTPVHAVNVHQPELVSELKPICHLYTGRYSVHTLAPAHTKTEVL